MTQVIDLDAGAIEYTNAVVLTGDDTLSGDTVEVGIGGYQSEGVTWFPSADPSALVTVTGPVASAQLLLGSVILPAGADWWTWIRLTDNPEVVPRRSINRVRIVNSGTSNLPLPD